MFVGPPITTAQQKLLVWISELDTGGWMLLKVQHALDKLFRM